MIQAEFSLKESHIQFIENTNSANRPGHPAFAIKGME